MPRLPYSEIDTDARKQVANRVVVERGSLLHLYKMLLHSAPIAEGWLTYLTAIRQKSNLKGDVRELVIMHVAQLNGASYEADQHRTIALAEGINQTQLDCLHNWISADCFSPMQRAILSYTEAMTRNVQVSEEIFHDVSSFFTTEKLVELTAVIATYNMVSRFLEALRIQSHDDV